jgi:CheY-like chemotaxis protein
MPRAANLTPALAQTFTARLCLARHEVFFRGGKMVEADRKRILVVEDEWLIADELVAMVHRMGYGVVGPASRVSRAMQLVESEKPDGAVLDITLGKEKSFPIAEMLAERGIPFLFVTGYAGGDLPGRFASCVVLFKPISDADLCAALTSMYERGNFAALPHKPQN